MNESERAAWRLRQQVATVKYHRFTRSVKALLLGIGAMVALWLISGMLP